MAGKLQGSKFALFMGLNSEFREKRRNLPHEHDKRSFL